MPTRLARLAPVLTLSLTGLSPSADAQGAVPERWLASTTSPVAAAGVVDGDDAAILRLEAETQPFSDLPLAGWLALAGFRPGDVDGLGLRPGAASGHRSALAFSLLSNEAGFLDGDVLGFAPGGGLELIVSEKSIAAALGLPDAAIDLDALDWDDAGRLCFSLQSDLTGTVLGDLANADVLRLEADGSVTRSFAEAQVQAAMEQAAGLTGSIGDVHGLTMVGGETWVVVQGPSTVDGTALRLGSAPVLAADELTLGLDGAELDAVVALGPSFGRGCLAVDVDLATPGSQVVGSGAGFAPMAPVAIVATGKQLPGLELGLGGFGELWLDHLDPVLAVPSWSVVATDAEGRFSLAFDLPPGLFGGEWMGTWGWTFQALDLAILELTAPVRIEL